MSESQMILFEQIRNLVEQARGRAARAVNQTMVETYWHIGRLIVEEEQGGEGRAVYGARLIPELSRRLTQEYGKGFDERNLRNMRQFFLTFPIRHAVRAESPEVSSSAISKEKSPIPTTSFLRPELSWTHYRLLLRVENPRARDWYMREAAEAGWSSRALERQINSHYYERLLASRDREKVQAEARTISSETALRPADTLKDPYVFEFLGLPSQTFLGAKAFGISQKEVSIDHTKLRPIFESRNRIIHELDINFNVKRRRRNLRTEGTMKNYTETLIELAENILKSVDSKLSKTKSVLLAGT